MIKKTSKLLSRKKSSKVQSPNEKRDSAKSASPKPSRVKPSRPKKATPSKTGRKSVKKTESTPDESMHGRVTKPLVPPKPRKKSTIKVTAKKPLKPKVTKKSNSKSSKAPTKKPSVFSRKKDDKQAYQSIKNRQKPIFSKATVGASTLGSIESDINRFKIVWGVACALLLVLVGRAFVLQVANAQFYVSKGDDIVTSIRTQPSYRGMIKDRNGLPLAISAPLSSVTFSPYDYAKAYYSLKKQIENNKLNPEAQQKSKERLANIDLSKLASVSGMSLERLQKAAALDDTIDVMDAVAIKKALPSGPGSRYLPIFNKVTPELADAVMSLDLPGVHEKQEYRRYYPQPQPNAQLLGFMSYNENDENNYYKGRAGIERLYEDKLAGEDGKVLVLKDAYQNSLKELEQVAPEIPGEDVTLSIDSRLQYLLYKELERVGRLQEARWSTGMVVDVHTGEVLAMSTWPSFNNNNLNEMTGDNQRNRTVLDVFEPGSVMKVFTVAAALDSGKYTERTLINTSPGSVRVKGYTIRDHGDLGSINMTTLIKKSSNVASTKIALSLPPDGISSMQKRFGFGSKTALGLPGEQAGIVPTPTEKETARRATISYGYGLQVTLAQIAQGYAVLGAGGIMHPLTLTKQDKAATGKRVIDSNQAMSIVKMMESVTQKGGTGTAAAIDGYRVAGKTGTSRRVNPDGGYYVGQYRTIFAGIAPVSNPRLATVILVEDPQKDHYAGVVAAPVFKNVMQEALRLYNVPLDKPLMSEYDNDAISE